MYNENEVRQRFREAVKMTGETIEKVAKRIFMNPTSLRCVLTGHRRIQIDDLVVFCQTYGFDLNYIAMGTHTGALIDDKIPNAKDMKEELLDVCPTNKQDEETIGETVEFIDRQDRIINKACLYLALYEFHQEPKTAKNQQDWKRKLYGEVP